MDIILFVNIELIFQLIHEHKCRSKKNNSTVHRLFLKNCFSCIVYEYWPETTE